MAKKIIENIKRKQKKVSEEIKRKKIDASNYKTMVFSRSQVDTGMEFRHLKFEDRKNIQEVATFWYEQGWLKGWYQGIEGILQWIKKNNLFSKEQCTRN